MSLPAVTVIVPIYGNEEYFFRCVSILRSQTLKNIEIILASDGPAKVNELCKEICEQDNRVKSIFFNGSYGKSVNASLKIALGKYISIVEIDDFCSLRFLEKLYEEAELTKADIVKCGFIESYDTDPSRNKIRRLKGNDLSEMIKTQSSIWSAIYRKSFLINNKIFFLERKQSFVDTAFQLECFLKARKIVTIHECLYFYTQDNLHQSIKDSNARYDVFYSLKFFLSRNSNLKSFEDNKEALLKTFLMILRWTFSNFIEKNHKEDITIFKNRCREIFIIFNVSKKELLKMSKEDIYFYKYIFQTFDVYQYSLISKFIISLKKKIGVI